MRFKVISEHYRASFWFSSPHFSRPSTRSRSDSTSYERASFILGLSPSFSFCPFLGPGVVSHARPRGYGLFPSHLSSPGTDRFDRGLSGADGLPTPSRFRQFCRSEGLPSRAPGFTRPSEARIDPKFRSAVSTTKVADRTVSDGRKVAGYRPVL